jgi:ribosomal protein S18 acetylase RimI-like enzyme
MTDSFQIKSLASISFDEIFETDLKAFKDYPFQWSKEGLLKTIQRRGYDASLSFGAFYNNELVSFTLNGTGFYNGLKTAYDTGTGTVSEHRGKGLASKIFEYSIPFLKSEGIEQYILEVLEENEKAFSVYAKQGFEVSRKFDCFRIETNKWDFIARENSNIKLKEIDFSFQKEMETMIDFNLSWQNSFQAMKVNPTDFIIIGAFKENNFVGYGIIETETGDISQLAVAKTERGNGIGSLILSELKKRNKADIIKIVNIESSSIGIINFITKCGIPKLVSQFEMIKSI